MQNMMNIKEVKFFDKKSAWHGNKFASCVAVKSEIILRKFEKFCRRFKKRKVYFYRQYLGCCWSCWYAFNE